MRKIKNNTGIEEQRARKEKKTRVLFCCAANMCRSPTGEHLLGLVKGYDVRSVGVCKGARVEVSQKLLNWADVVFVMEYWMKEQLLLHFRVRADKIKVLGIKDRHFYGEPELVKTIADRLKRQGIDAANAVDEFAKRLS